MRVERKEHLHACDSQTNARAPETSEPPSGGLTFVSLFGSKGKALEHSKVTYSQRGPIGLGAAGKR